MYSYTVHLLYSVIHNYVANVLCIYVCTAVVVNCLIMYCMVVHVAHYGVMYGTQKLLGLPSTILNGRRVSQGNTEALDNMRTQTKEANTLTCDTVHTHVTLYIHSVFVLVHMQFSVIPSQSLLMDSEHVTRKPSD